MVLEGPLTSGVPQDSPGARTCTSSCGGGSVLWCACCVWGLEEGWLGCGAVAGSLLATTAASRKEASSPSPRRFMHRIPCLLVSLRTPSSRADVVLVLSQAGILHWWPWMRGLAALLSASPPPLLLSSHHASLPALPTRPQDHQTLPTQAMSISTNPVGKVWVENMFLWLFPLLLFVYKMLYEYLPLPAFAVCLVVPAIYIYRVTKDLSPVEAADELNKRNRQAEEMWEELTKEEEEAEEEERRRNESKQHKKKQQSISQSIAPAAAVAAAAPVSGGKKTKKQQAAAERAAAEEEEEDMLSRMAQQRSKKAVR